MRIITILFVLIFTCTTGFSQTEKKAGKSALKCIDNTLAIAGKDFNYIIASSIECQDLYFCLRIPSHSHRGFSYSASDQPHILQLPLW